MQPFKRRAEWIWRRRGLSGLAFGQTAGRLAAEANRYVYFRRVVEVDGEVERAGVHVSADGRYQLFVNGRFVGRGPARSNPAWQCVDPYDLRPYLRPGRNVIAALVHAYGRHTAWYELPGWDQARLFGCGGFFLQGDLVAGGEPVRLDASRGDAWRCLTSPAWQQDVPGSSLGFVEVYDARLAPTGWTGLEFDDSAWEAAEVLRLPGRNFSGDVVPFPVLVPRDIPPLLEEVRFPARVLRVAEVTNAPGAGDVAAQLAREPLAELSACRAHNVDRLAAGQGAAEFVTAGERSVALIFDCDGLVTGRVRFELDGPAGAVIDLAYGERLLPDGRVRPEPGIPQIDTPIAHRYILRQGPQSWETFEWGGFRYLQLTIRHAPEPLRLRSLGVNFTTYPVEARGRFACSDESLNWLWEIGANTLRLCMHDAYVDCPSREQRQWMGDAYVEMLINFAAFGDDRLAARILRQIGQSQQGDGLTMMTAPADFAAGRFMNIPDFCLYWLLTLDRYALYSGDTALIGELYPTAVKAVAWFERHLNEEDLLTDVPHWVFIDWAELDKQGQVTALNAQFVAALRAVAGFARQVNALEDAARFGELAERVAAAINEQLWDEERGVYVDARRDGVRSRRVSQQSNAAAIAFDVAPPERWPRILETILDEARLVLTRWADRDPRAPAFDEAVNVVRAQPFYCHHLHRALSKAGRHEDLLDHIRRHWESLVDEGGDTFRETWQLDEITSLCHAWSGTPTFDLSTEVLGITPLRPGFDRFRVAPQPAGLTWAEGVFPSPRGDIKLAWQIEADHVALQLEIPFDSEAEVFPPLVEGRTWAEIEVDGGPVPANPIIVGPGAHRIICRLPET